jgi:hypothetical protein
VIPTNLNVLAPILDVLVVLWLFSAGFLLVWEWMEERSSNPRSRKRLHLPRQYPCRRAYTTHRRRRCGQPCARRRRWTYIGEGADRSKGFWEVVQGIESGRRLPLEMENSSRNAVTKVLTDLILTQLGGIDSYEERANELPVKQERMRLEKETTEESILTLMKVADELDLYEDVVRDIVIPQRIKAYFWGPEHPNTQRP